MTTKLINKEKFKEAIQAAYENDMAIFDMYDPNSNVSSVEDIVSDIYKKVSAFDNTNIYGVYEKNELVGYYVTVPKMLVSFGLNNQYRVRSKLREFFSLMREGLGSKWGCLLWTKNVRGIKWLLKQGLKKIDSNNLITVLHFGKN